jgi:hypothetical protein
MILTIVLLVSFISMILNDMHFLSGIAVKNTSANKLDTNYYFVTEWGSKNVTVNGPKGQIRRIRS